MSRSLCFPGISLPALPPKGLSQCLLGEHMPLGCLTFPDSS